MTTSIVSKDDMKRLTDARISYQAFSAYDPVDTPEANAVCSDIAKYELADYLALLSEVYAKYGIDVTKHRLDRDGRLVEL